MRISDWSSDVCSSDLLEDWLIAALARFSVRGERREGRVGIWVDRGAGREDKIAAIGVRLRRWVSYHGIALNVEPDLSHFDRSEEHTSELQSLMRNSYAGFCLETTTQQHTDTHTSRR